MGDGPNLNQKRVATDCVGGCEEREIWRKNCYLLDEKMDEIHGIFHEAPTLPLLYAPRNHRTFWRRRVNSQATSSNVSVLRRFNRLLFVIHTHDREITCIFIHFVYIIIIRWIKSMCVCNANTNWSEFRWLLRVRWLCVEEIWLRY